MSYSVLNNSIAGVSKNGELIGAFKLVHIFQGVYKKTIFENVEGAGVVKRNEKTGDVEKEDVTGFKLYFQYKNTSGKWSGVLIEDDKGEYMAKGCVNVEVALPKALVSNAKLTQLLLLLGVAKKDEIVELDETLLTDDTSETDDMSLEDLEDDSDDDDEFIDNELSLESIFDELTPFINRIFTAPYTKNAKGYANPDKDFTKWSLVPKKSK